MTRVGHICLALLAAFAMPSVAAMAQTSQPPKVLSEILVDIDRDGTQDRAVLIQSAEAAPVDLHIYLAEGGRTLDLLRKPDFLKRDIVPLQIVSLQSRQNGSLLVTSGCGGCSNATATTLTIVHRAGKFLVAGFTFEWDTRTSMGVCDVNYLAGKGFMSRGLNGRKTPIKARFRAVNLADWSEANRPAACRNL